MSYDAKLVAEIKSSPWQMQALHLVREVLGDGGWIGAGFVRNPIWDARFGVARQPPPEDDIDVLYFDPARLSPSHDTAIEARLTALSANWSWQVRNQARMHVRNGDGPYRSIVDAMGAWLETATAIAVRLDSSDEVQVMSAYGLEDLFDGVLRPTPAGRAKPTEFQKRINEKKWLARWPSIRVMESDEAPFETPFKARVA